MLGAAILITGPGCQKGHKMSEEHSAPIFRTELTYRNVHKMEEVFASKCWYSRTRLYVVIMYTGNFRNIRIP